MGRGAAALAVVLLHAEGMLLPGSSASTYGFGGLFKFGFLGVDFFFVLSGFIIYFVHADHIGKPALAISYISRRAFRILPAYWAVLAFMLLSLPFQKIWPTISTDWLFGQLVLLGKTLWVGQAWTLQHEFLFYGFFLLLILIGRTAWLLMLAWIVACVSIAYGKADVPRSTLFDIVFHPYHAMFLVGIITAQMTRASARAWRYYCLSVSVSVFGCIAFLSYFNASLSSHSANRYYCATAFGNACLVALIVMSRAKISTPKLFSWLGKISYSMYICHGLVFMVFYSLCIRMNAQALIAPVLIFTVGTLACIAVSALMQRWIEVPAIEFGKRFATKLTPAKL